ncbi:MAG: FAD-dependent oxidoreductase [Coriobacteriia bacterium]|nr:FAD-dependent oxidoreductase [Coriobacteriia bacterium]
MDREYIETVPDVAGSAGSVWLDAEAADYPSLDGERDADILIVGCGLTGALLARRLVGEGRVVMMLERRRIASGTTGHSTAKVTALHGDSWRALLAKNSREDVCTWAAANLAAVEEFSAIALDLGTTCGLRRVPAYLVAGDDEASASIPEHLEALVSAGLPATPADAPRPFGRPAALLQDQALIDPAAFVLELLASLGAQVEVHERTAVRSLERDGEFWRALCDGASVRAPIAILADHVPMHDTGAFFTRLFPYAHYALEFVPQHPLPDGMWMQVGGEALTLRPTLDVDGTWIAGGERVRVGSEADERAAYGRLAASVARVVGDVEVVRHWSAHDHETPDGLPFIGEAPLGRNLFMATGFAGWGMTKSVVAASVIADAVAGRSGPLTEIVSPRRGPGLTSVPSLAAENATVAREFMEGHLTSRRGKAHEDSAAGRSCTHLGCETKWNTAEGTVDCPCHGSRFGRHGDVIYGPASRDIESEP